MSQQGSSYLGFTSKEERFPVILNIIVNAQDSKTLHKKTPVMDYTT